MCRTVSDAVYVLDVIAGVDYKDKATIEASKYIPRGGYKQFLKPYGLKGKRLDFLRNGFFNFNNGSLFFFSRLVGSAGINKYLTVPLSN